MSGSHQDRLDPQLIQRFARDLDAIAAPRAKLGLAVSGGADSLALLLLAASARPSLVEAATVDHALRAESRSEAELVASICASLGVPHTVLTVHWDEKPRSAVQERARAARYALLWGWAADRRLDAIATGHHSDDQAETLLMRLARGAGVTGLAAMRPRSVAPGSAVPLLRPLLGWRREELEGVCATARVTPVADPSNADARFERVRVRDDLARLHWLNAAEVARSAQHLADADDAIAWAAAEVWERAVIKTGGKLVYRPTEAPPEIRRRIVTRAVLELASEGAAPLRGREIDTLLLALENGGTATLRGVRCTGGEAWHFTTAPTRRS